MGFFGVLFAFLRKAETVCREKHALNFEQIQYGEDYVVNFLKIHYAVFKHFKILNSWLLLPWQLSNMTCLPKKEQLHTTQSLSH